MDHVILLGDSTFDNGRYVPDGPAIVDQLRLRLPRAWRATLLARDGAVARDVPDQLGKLPEDASHLIVSAGGNNALENTSIFGEPFESIVGAFDRLGEIHEQFGQEYQEMLAAVVARKKPTAICTIYDAIPNLTRVERTALAVFNDVIVREGVRHGLPVLDLRSICNEARDYSSVSSIEPSEIGGAKIAQAIRRLVTGHDFGRGECIAVG